MSLFKDLFRNIGLTNILITPVFAIIFGGINYLVLLIISYLVLGLLLTRTNEINITRDIIKVINLYKRFLILVVLSTISIFLYFVWGNGRIPEINFSGFDFVNSIGNFNFKTFIVLLSIFIIVLFSIRSKILVNLFSFFGFISLLIFIGFFIVGFTGIDYIGMKYIFNVKLSNLFSFQNIVNFMFAFSNATLSLGLCYDANKYDSKFESKHIWRIIILDLLLQVVFVVITYSLVGRIIAYTNNSFLDLQSQGFFIIIKLVSIVYKSPLLFFPFLAYILFIVISELISFVSSNSKLSNNKRVLLYFLYLAYILLASSDGTINFIVPLFRFVIIFLTPFTCFYIYFMQLNKNIYTEILYSIFLLLSFVGLYYVSSIDKIFLIIVVVITLRYFINTSRIKNMFVKND